jgi:hypothetical protein
VSPRPHGPSSACAIIEALRAAPGKATRGDPHEAYLAIERFLKASKKPVLIEPGEDPFALASDTFKVSQRASSVTIECWDEKRTLVRRVASVRLERPGRLELHVEHFGGRAGALTLIDLDRETHRDAARKGARLKYRERFRQSLHRQFPDWRVVELSTEQDLHNSFSPAYPRALLRHGRTALAAIGIAESSPSPADALTFGLIWLDHLRRREQRLTIDGLVLFAPAGQEHGLCHRVRFLDPRVARYLIFVHDSAGYEQSVDPGDYTNLDTRLAVGVKQARAPRPRQPEAWLERRVRADLESLDATLLTHPVYGQVAQFAGGDRGIIDLLAIDRDGRLAVIELKVDQNIHLPLQALDYWMRVKWHLDRGEIAESGHFTGLPLLMEAPRLLLVAPALEFHPANEIVLSFFSPEIPVERIGLGVQWRQELKVMFRAPQKTYSGKPWPLLSSAR